MFVKRKKWLAVLLVSVLLLSFTACKEPATEEKREKTNAAGNENRRPNPSDGTTLMIYMVGSDLEAKGGSGTKDLEEILNSQVDLTYNNVLVYAGGAKKWHNDAVDTADGHTILQLTADGFETLEIRNETSMGEADTLSYFLNYTYNHFATNNYALILWDHGNGPLIGYGKDMLHENDSLTLLEMREALENAPFTADNKLDWVGFDACLMASVELACVWQDYADYMIASQEVEPAFGWDYAFLRYLGMKDAVSLADEITSGYMDSCLEYYERRNYDQRDTTLSCLDLSKVTPLRTALEDLFGMAKADVQAEYSELVATRVNTRALGRATTGSEYDLIDLVDMAQKMEDRYPVQAQAVQQAAQAMVVHNVTNTEDCCGLSIYYPFYNKSYYKKAWADVYSELNVLPEYTEYLQAYAKRWLQNDLLQSVASSTQPEARSESEFVLQLTEQQAENFADARFYILQQEGDQLYTRIYTSANVTKEGTVLTAEFDGNVLYAKNHFDVYWIPVAVEHDTVGEYTRYSTYVSLTNDSPFYYDLPERHERKTEGHRFHISINNETNEVKTAALVPYTTQVDTQTLVGGKQEDADLSQWSEYYFLHERHLYLERDKNGTILPLDQWQKSGVLTAMVSRVDDGIEFVMAPIPGNDYYLIFEIEDVQGNRYCSEMLPIHSEGATLPGDFREEPAEVTWESGDKVKLFSQEGITAYLTTVKSYTTVRYALQVENNNDFDVGIMTSNEMFNGIVDFTDGFGEYLLIPAGETATGTGFNFGDAENVGALDEMESIQFSFTAITAFGDRTLVFYKPVWVNLSKYAAGLRQDPPEGSVIGPENYKIDSAAYGLMAKEQVVFERDGLRGILLGMGGHGSDDDRLIIKMGFENISSEEKTFQIYGWSFDGVFVNSPTENITVAPNTRIYRLIVLYDDELTLNQISTASSVSVWVAHKQFAPILGGGGFAQIREYSIKLDVRGKKVNFQHGSTLLYQDASVQIFLKKAEQDRYDYYTWTCTMVNRGDRDLHLSTYYVVLNGKIYTTDSMMLDALVPYDVKCPAGKATSFEVKYIGDETGSLEMSFKPQFYNMSQEELLYEGSKPIVLSRK